MSADWRIVPLGDRALIIAFEARVDPVVNRRVRAAAARLTAAALPGVVDVVPAFCTVAVHYRPEQIADAMPSDDTVPWVAPFDRLAQRIEAVLTALGSDATDDERTVRIPVCYGGRHGPDLETVASAVGLAADAVVDLHIRSAHRVYMLGFSPGFPYIGGLDPRLSMPRRSTPRTRIPAGTVAIARDQTAIYTFETPGGWNLIGRTPVRLFDPQRDPPCLLQAGDRVAFEPIDEQRFRELADAASDGPIDGSLAE